MRILINQSFSKFINTVKEHREYSTNTVQKQNKKLPQLRNQREVSFQY